MGVDFKEIIVFEGKTFDSLLKDIYSKSEKKSKEFDGVMSKIIEIATANPSQAANLMPLLTEYAEASIKNDDTLIKLANIIQRFHAKSTSNNDAIESDWNLPQHEIDALLANTKEISDIQIIELPIQQENE